MAIGSRSYARPYLGGGGLPPAIKWLLIANTVMFFAVFPFFGGGLLGGAVQYLALSPWAVVKSFQIWQLGTYLFINPSVLGFVFNMLALWMFGRELEGIWGTERFLRFYFLCGSGAGVFAVLTGLAFGGGSVVGCIGAIYGILAASAALWPERQVLFFFFPMKMKFFVLLIAAVDFLLSYGSPVYIALLTGLLFGYFYVKYPRKRGFDPMASLRASYRQWKLQRAKRKFQVYLRKQGSDRDRFVN